jgi:hypothetical protein
MPDLVEARGQTRKTRVNRLTAMASAIQDEVPHAYQSPFDSQDADIVLHSTGGSFYRIPSFTLRNTSGFFRAMLSLPGNGGTPNDVPIPIDEKDNVLERLLRMISGLETPKWESFDELEEVSSLAENWDTPGPLAIIRLAVTSPLFLEDPLRLYVITTHFEWEEEAKLASRYTLNLSLHDSEHRTVLHRLSAKHLLALLNFHRTRRDMFKRLIESEESFDAENAVPFRCTMCGRETDNYAWRDLKTRMLLEMDRRPLGDTLCGLGTDEWPVSEACWNTQCKNEGCGKAVYHKALTLMAIKYIIDELPLTI